MVWLKNFTTGAMDLMVCGMLLTYPFSLTAQETIQKARKATGENGTRTHDGHSDRDAEAVQTNEGDAPGDDAGIAEAADSPARARHSDGGDSDEKQLLAEMKKHLRMIDEFLDTMVEQRATLDAERKDLREQMWHWLGQPWQTEQEETKGHEEHRRGGE